MKHATFNKYGLLSNISCAWLNHGVIASKSTLDTLRIGSRNVMKNRNVMEFGSSYADVISGKNQSHSV